MTTLTTAKPPRTATSWRGSSGEKDERERSIWKMSEKPMERQKVDLDALEAALAKASLPDTMRILSATISLHPQGPDMCSNDEQEAYFALAHNALPALIAELRELRARMTPEPIGEKHKDGQEWLVYWTEAKRWRKCYWANGGGWIMSGVGYLDFGTPTHALPLPPDPEVLNA